MKLARHSRTLVKAVGGGLAIVSAISYATYALMSDDREFGREQATTAVTVGVGSGPATSLFWLAQQNGNFRDVSLDLTVKSYQAGKLAADALLRGEVDIAISAEFVVVRKSFAEPDLRILGSISTVDNLELVMRRDGGVHSQQDIRGKVIGVTRGSTAEYFLGSFLLSNGLTLDQIQIVDMKPSELVNAIVGGTVDAVLTWDPFLDSIKLQLGDNAISFPAQSYQDYYFVLVTKDEWIRDNLLAAQRILSALVKAERFASENPVEFEKFLKSHYELSAEDVEQVMRDYRFDVTLPQAILPGMEAEARWMIESRLTDQAEIPNFLDILTAAPLQAVDADAVTLVQ